MPVITRGGCLGWPGWEEGSEWGEFLSYSEGRFLAHQLREKRRVIPGLSLGF